MEEVAKEIDKAKFIEMILNIEARKISNYTKCIKEFYTLARRYNSPDADKIMVDFFNETFIKD